MKTVACMLLGLIGLLATMQKSAWGQSAASQPALQAAAASNEKAPATRPATVYQFTAKDIDGHDKSLADYSGKVLLVVNVASKCGFTKQYEGLEKLYEAYKDKGLVVLGVPSNDFGGQEPGTEAEIKAFCTAKYSVTFPMLSKVSVKNGANQCDLYNYLTHKSRNGVLDAEVAWNFNKFLVGKDGKVVHYFPSKVKPDDAPLVDAINEALGQTASR